ncbi:MAG: hypothetical protein PWP07_1409 [Epulopiscium sp.]|nr:hypothetical protein [Candidatus Epulonipiscium sp.]
MRKRDLAIFIIIGLIVFLFTMAIYLSTANKFKVDSMEKEDLLNKGNVLKYHFAVICESMDEPFWQSLRKGAKKAGEDFNVAVEFNGPRTTNVEEEIKYLEIAIASKVDGIITHISDEEKMTPYIDKAVDMGIPVITLNNDAQSSMRQSYVGVNRYNLGLEWGKLIALAASDKDTVVGIIYPDYKNFESNHHEMILLGINESTKSYPNIQFKIVSVKDSEIFSSEEAIREILINDDHVNMILCMNAADTLRAAKAVVDLNRVGDVTIIGYHDNPEILNYIKNGVIYGTIAGDAMGMGYKSIEAMVELKENKRASEFITSKLNVITNDNVQKYIVDKEKKEYFEDGEK